MYICICKYVLNAVRLEIKININSDKARKILRNDIIQYT